MPLYFFLSGLFFKDYGSLVNLIEKKLNKLILPFLFFSVIALPIIFINFHTISINDLTAPFANPQGGYNLVVWFLMCLFWVNILFGIISLTTQNNIIIGLLICFLGAIGCRLGLQKYALPLHITQSLIALPFFFAGYMTKKTPLLYKNEKFDKWLLPISITLILGCWIAFRLSDSPRIEFLYLDFNGNILLAYLFSLTIIYGILFLCKKIKWAPVLSYIGRYSLIVLGTHWLIIKIYSLAYTYLISPDLNIPVRFLVVILSCWIAIPLFKRCFPSFTAQKDLIKLKQILPA